MRAELPFCLCLAVLLTGVLRADEPKPSAPEPKPADGDAPLPEGWPAATKPGAIEVREYPAYRSAVARAKETKAEDADSLLFFQLFAHISRKEIAMTAPVVNTYEPGLVADPEAEGEVSMEFLYGSPTMGEIGEGVGQVKVEDHPAGQFVALGVQGRMDEEVLRDGVTKLRDWLKEHEEWIEAGPPRRLGYHGPMTPERKRWWEVQIPVKPAKEGAAASPKS